MIGNLRDKALPLLCDLALGRALDFADDFFKRNRGKFQADAPCLDLCLLYTSDAADDLLCVDLGGRRII